MRPVRASWSRKVAAASKYTGAVCVAKRWGIGVPKPEFAAPAQPIGVRERDYDCRMPIYEFECPACGHRFEELTGSQSERATCPECGCEDAGRLLSAPAPPRRLTMGPDAARRAEDKRGTSRGGAMQRFKKQRAREKRAGGDGG